MARDERGAYFFFFTLLEDRAVLYVFIFSVWRSYISIYK